MNRRILPVVERYLASLDQVFADLDVATRGRRGPKGAPLKACIGAVIYNLLAHKPPTVLGAARTLRDETSPAELAVFGLSAPPSCYSVYRTFGRLNRVLASRNFSVDPENPPASLDALLAANDDPALRAVLHEMLRSASTPTSGEAQDGLWSLDTTYLDSNCRPISHEAYDAGDRASDPDASGRIIARPGVDPKKYFGYRLTSASRSQGEHEYIDAFRIGTASSHDRPAALEIAADLVARGEPIRYLAIDRGFNSAAVFADLRALGVEPVFDFNKGTDRLEGVFRGLLIVGGWLHSPALPERLRSLPPKPVGPPAAEVDEWCRLHDERQRYAWRIRCVRGPGDVQLMPPVGVGCKHVSMRPSMRDRDLALKTCPGEHGPDEGCCLNTVLWKAENAPMTWQAYPWGSKKWRRLYKLRSSVERNYSLLKNSDIVDVSHARIRLRTIGKVSLMLAMAVAATNLHLANCEIFSDRRVTPLARLNSTLPHHNDWPPESFGSRHNTGRR